MPPASTRLSLFHPDLATVCVSSLTFRPCVERDPQDGVCPPGHWPQLKLVSHDEFFFKLCNDDTLSCMAS